MSAKGVWALDLLVADLGTLHGALLGGEVHLVGGGPALPHVALNEQEAYEEEEGVEEDIGTGVDRESPLQ